MNRVKELINILDCEIDADEYQLARYLNDTSVDLRGNYEYNWYSYGFGRPQDSDLRKPAYTNVIKSVIDSLVSKLYNQKVRPYFNPVNGTWQTKRTVKNVQQFFDILFDNQKINKKVSDAFLCACVMGKGHIYLNPLNSTIEMVPGHCIATLQSESRANKNTQGVIRYLNYPAELVKTYCPDIETNVDNYRYVTLAHYFNIEDKEQIIFINGQPVFKKEYEADELPWITVYYNDPIYGNTTTSIVRELEGIQTQVDMINQKMAAAAQLSDASKIFVFEGSSLTPKDLGNKAGMVYGVRTPIGSNAPPVVSVQDTPFSPFWLQLIDWYIKQAYEMVGISQLSAMSKKPQGLDSGVALQTLEDVESDRFERQVTHYVQSFVDLARLIIKIMPEDADILPPSANSSSLKWKDVKKQSDLFKIQYSAASAFSKNPSEKQKQIIEYNQIGLVPKSKIARFIDQPDLEEAFAGASAVADGVSQVIANAIENEDYSIPDFVSYKDLAQEITITENQLYSSFSGDKKNDKLISESLERLLRLEESLLDLMEEVGYVDMGNDTGDADTSDVAQSDSGLTASEADQVADITTELSDNAQKQEQMANPPETGEF